MKRYVALISILIHILFIRFIAANPNVTSLHDKQMLSFTSQLSSAAQLKGPNQRFSVVYKGNRILITTKAYPFYLYGNRLEISGKVKENIGKSAAGLLTMYYSEFRLLFQPNPFDE